MAKDKRPKTKVAPSEAKQARQAGPPSYQGALVRWRFAQADWDGPWCPKKGFGSVPLKILQKLAEFDTRRWGEVEGTESHQIDVTSIGAEAQKRLDSVGHLKARQIETLFSMRFGARERLWGVREGDTLHILWWDPEHEVYPTKPKNT